MTFYQGGADFPGPKTKTALKKAIKDEPGTVGLYNTSMFGGYTGPASELPEGSSFNVVGPDPERSRIWYATVKMNKGRVTVS